MPVVVVCWNMLFAAVRFDIKSDDGFLLRFVFPLTNNIRFYNLLPWPHSFSHVLCFLSILGCMLRLLFVYFCKPSFLFSIVEANFIVVTGREDRWYAIFSLMCELRKYSATANNMKFAKGREVFIMIYLSLIKSYRFDLMPNAGIFLWFFSFSSRSMPLYIKKFEAGVCRLSTHVVRFVWITNLLGHWKKHWQVIIYDNKFFLTSTQFHWLSNIVKV